MGRGKKSPGKKAGARRYKTATSRRKCSQECQWFHGKKSKDPGDWLSRKPKKVLRREVAADEIQAATLIENERLFQEVQNLTGDLAELRHQAATAKVLKVISRSTFDLPAVLDALVGTAAQLCEADKGTITRQKDDNFYRAELYGFSEEFMKHVRSVPVVLDRKSATGRPLVEGSVIHIPDVEADQDYAFREGQRLGDFRSLLGVPMLRQVCRLV